MSQNLTVKNKIGKYLSMNTHVNRYFSSNDLGRNHVNETTRHGIIAHRIWEENLGNVTEIIVTDSFGFVAQTLSQKRK